MNPHNLPKSYKGFTLLELLISMTIVAVIVVIIFGALRVSLRAWEKGESDIARQQRYRIVLSLINRQMSSIYLKKVKKEDKQELVLKGTPESFEFVSNVSLLPDNDYGMVFAKYNISETEDGTKRLTLFEKNLVFFNEKSSFTDIDPDEFYEMIPSAEQISFEYFNVLEPEDFREWQDNWSPEDQQQPPLAIRISIVPEADMAPVVIIAPINQESDENASL
jgi:general secretion pathway protein J